MAVLLAGLALVSPLTAIAQNAQWLTNPGSNDFGTASNWSPASVPTGVASFGASNTTAVQANSSQTIGTVTFLAGAPAYTLSIGGSFELTGSGIVNQSTMSQTLAVNGAGGSLTFSNSSTANGAVITNSATSQVSFDDTSSAGTASISNAGTLCFCNDASAGSASITNSGTVNFFGQSSASTSTLINQTGGTINFTASSSGASARYVGQGGTLDISQLSASGTTLASIAGTGTISLGSLNLAVGANGTSTTFSGTIADGGTGGGTGGSLTKVGAGILTLSGANTYTGGTTVSGGLVNFSAANNFGTGAITLNGGGLQWAAGNTADISSRLSALGAAGGTFDTNGNNVAFAASLSGSGGLTKNGLGTLTLSGNNTYQGGTTINAGILALASGASLGSGPLTLNGGTFNNGGNNVTLSSLSGTSGSLVLSGGGLTVNSTGNATYGGSISGTGALVKQGGGTLTLSGNNSYTGGTTVSAGTLAGTTSGLQGNIVNNATVSFNQASNGLYAGMMSGTGSVIVSGGGLVNFTGNNTYTGPTTVNGGTLAVNGSITSNVTVNGGTLGGTGTISGNVAMLGTLAPGNSIGTLTVNGGFTQGAGSTYLVEVNSAGQSDKLAVTGAASLGGGTVAVQAQSGTYARNTTYTILTANGGVTGTYSSVTSNFAFLTPTLSYDANNVYLGLFMNQSAFAAGSQTPNQFAVGSALDQSYANATGDFATVINALSVLSIQTGPWALNQISGQPYADFGSFNVANNALFMNALGQQMALARGGLGSGQRLALAEACDAAACDGTSAFGVWGSVLGGLGSVQGDGNSQTLTYNVGGGAAGIDYRFDPRFLAGVAAGYTNGTQWADTFMGKGWSNTVSVAAYGSFTQAGFYVDSLAGYAYSNNQMQRQIMIPGLQPRTANGSTGANQFLGQVEAGFKFSVDEPAAATLTPFARFQTSNINQAAFSEWGANSLNLNVQQQTTTSVRTTLGADLAGAIGLGDTHALGLGLRLGWLHEYASTARPITAAFAGAPTASFTVYGATPQRDSAVIGFSASTDVAAATRLYLRYDGELGSGSDNHDVTVGMRLNL